MNSSCPSYSLCKSKIFLIINLFLENKETAVVDPYVKKTIKHCNRFKGAKMWKEHPQYLEPCCNCHALFKENVVFLVLPCCNEIVHKGCLFMWFDNAGKVCPSCLTDE